MLPLEVARGDQRTSYILFNYFCFSKNKLRRHMGIKREAAQYKES